MLHVAVSCNMLNFKLLPEPTAKKRWQMPPLELKSHLMFFFLFSMYKCPRLCASMEITETNTVSKATAPCITEACLSDLPCCCAYYGSINASGVLWPEGTAAVPTWQWFNKGRRQGDGELSQPLAYTPCTRGYKLTQFKRKKRGLGYSDLCYVCKDLGICSPSRKYYWTGPYG